MNEEMEPPPTRRRGHRQPAPWVEFVPAMWLFGILLGTSVAAAIACRVTDSESPWIDLAMTTVDAIVILAFCFCERRTIAPMLGFAAITTRGWAITGVAFAAMAVVAEAWFWLADLLFETVDMLPTFREHGWPLWSAFVLTAVCPPLFEELAFRGYLQQRLTRLIGARDALILQATLFSILHLSIAILPSHFAMGLAMGFVAQRTGSLLPGMLMHAAWNSWVVVQELGQGRWY